MKHAGGTALDRLEPILKALRKIDGLKEKSRGAFYFGGRAFLHFHEHGDAFFADMRTGDDFERFPATEIAEQAHLLKKARTLIGAGRPAPKKNAKRTS